MADLHAHGLQVHCPGTSILHIDGTTECELPGCTLAHELHEWVATDHDLAHGPSPGVAGSAGRAGRVGRAGALLDDAA